MKLQPSWRKFCVHHTTMHHVTSCKATYVRCMHFNCNLPPALLAEWPGSFTCYCGNTGVERIPKYRVLTVCVCTVHTCMQQDMKGWIIICFARMCKIYLWWAVFRSTLRLWSCIVFVCWCLGDYLFFYSFSFTSEEMVALIWLNTPEKYKYYNRTHDRRPPWWETVATILKVTRQPFQNSLKQNEAQSESACAESTNKGVNQHSKLRCHTTLPDDVPLVKFMYLVFTYLPGESYCRWIKSSLLCLCDIIIMSTN